MQLIIICITRARICIFFHNVYILLYYTYIIVTYYINKKKISGELIKETDHCHSPNIAQVEAKKDNLLFSFS